MLTALLALALTAAPSQTKVALLPLAPGEGVNEATAEAVTQAVAAELRRFPALQLLTKGELAAVLSVERQKALVGCQSEQCLTELGGALNVAELVTGSVAKLGQSWIIHLQRVDARTAVTTASADSRKKGGTIDDVLDALPDLAHQLYAALPAPPTTKEPSNKAVVATGTSATPVPPGGKDEPLELDRKKLKVVTDGAGLYLAFEPFAGTDTPFLAGDGKSFWAQRVFGSHSQGEKSFGMTFWEPRARVPAEASFDLRDGKYLLSCGEKEVTMTELPAAKAKKLLADAKLFQPRWRRRAHALARDDEGTTFYVDRAREPANSNDFRVFIGSPGKFAASVPEVLAADSDGEIFGVAGGKLRLAHNKGEAEWIQGGQKMKLTWLPIESNAQNVYSRLGVYNEPLRTPCDGRL